MARLKNKIGIVTGAGSGIGRGIAQLFAAEGAHVIIADVAQETGEETVRLIKAAGGVAAFVQVDIASSMDVDKLIRFTVDQFGLPNILCNNAGIMNSEPLLISDLSEQAWDRTLAVNLKGVFLCCKYALPEMIKSGGGSVVNIASIAGLVKSPNYAYAASKGGIIALTRSIALRYGDYNIRANAICPGSIDTPGRAGLRQSKIIKEDLATRVVRKEGAPEDIAYAAVYLASDESAFVTGSTMVVDGGSLRG